MFARVFAVLPLALLVSAGHLTARGQCDSGSISCCNQVQSASQSQALLTQYGLVALAAELGGLVGANCSPVTIIGTSQSCAATQQSVCCTNNQFNGLVNLGCNNINLVA